MTFLEERTIGPELGKDLIDAGRLSSIIATAAVVAYMIASYGLFGVFASIAVIANVILILSVMSMIGATLTLPGIAGIVLTVGTAVDANVIMMSASARSCAAASGWSRLSTTASARRCRRSSTPT